VTRVFDDMLARSIPAYAEMRLLCAEIARAFRQPVSHVVDLGCSRGGAIAALVDDPGQDAVRYLGVEVSEPMVAAARARFTSHPEVRIERKDLRYEAIGLGEEAACVVQSVLTLQFVPIEYRQRVVKDAYDVLQNGGVFVLVEKILGSSAEAQRFLVDAYHGFKRGNGYSQDEIDRKRFALEGALVPQTEAANVDMLRREGFRVVEGFWRYLNFCGWIAVK
jgi:tRNA (cmo5U34)-methyltransferase